MSMVHLKAPPGFVCNDKGLPEMSLVGEPDQGAWTATRVIIDRSHALKVTWEADKSQYLCCYTVNESPEPQEIMALDYPHEVVNWVGRWYKKLHGHALQVEEE
jgi:hypothetical protein